MVMGEWFSSLLFGVKSWQKIPPAMTRLIVFSSFFLVAFSLAACAPGGPAPVVDETRVFETVAVQLNATHPPDGQTAPTAAVQAETAAVQQGAQTSQAQPQPVQTQAATAEAPCNRAAAGKPIDISIPDGMRVSPGQVFTKTWRLTNDGVCPWTEDYSLSWFSGMLMGEIREQPLRVLVPPGQAVEISVDQIAPVEPGMYQSNWKLRGTDGKLFGIGPAGDSPFWVRVEVYVEVTPAPENLDGVAETPTPTVFGRLVLHSGEMLDLDSGMPGEQPGNDVMVTLAEGDMPVVSALHTAALALIGPNEPTELDCLSASRFQEQIRFDSGFSPVYICYRTNQGQTGYLLIERVDTAASQFDIGFKTWPLP